MGRNVRATRGGGGTGREGDSQILLAQGNLIEWGGVPTNRLGTIELEPEVWWLDGPLVLKARVSLTGEVYYTRDPGTALRVNPETWSNPGGSAMLVWEESDGEDYNGNFDSLVRQLTLIGDPDGNVTVDGMRWGGAQMSRLEKVEIQWCDTGLTIGSTSRSMSARDVRMEDCTNGVVVEGAHGPTFDNFSFDRIDDAGWCMDLTSVNGANMTQMHSENNDQVLVMRNTMAGNDIHLLIQGANGGSTTPCIDLSGTLSGRGNRVRGVARKCSTAPYYVDHAGVDQELCTLDATGQSWAPFDIEW